MGYVEVLRVRRSLRWYLGVLAALTLLALAFAHDTSITFDGSKHILSGRPVPLGMLAPLAMFFAMIFASSAGTSLNRENATRDISWTKPVSRTVVALQFVLVDVAAIVVVFALAMLAAVAVLLRIHIVPVYDGTFVPQVALGVGVMWYGLIQVLSFWFGSGARSLGGILWPIAFIDLALTRVPGTLGAFARALEVLNPLAYVSGIANSSKSAHLMALSAETRALWVWVLAALFCAIAVTLWPRKEA